MIATPPPPNVTPLMRVGAALRRLTDSVSLLSKKMGKSA